MNKINLIGHIRRKCQYCGSVENCAVFEDKQGKTNTYCYDCVNQLYGTNFKKKKEIKEEDLVG